MKGEYVYIPLFGTGVFVIKTDSVTLEKYVTIDGGKKYLSENIEYFECNEKNRKCLSILYDKKFGLDDVIRNNDMLAKLLDNGESSVICMLSDGEFVVINKKSPHCNIFHDVLGVVYINRVLTPVTVSEDGVYEITSNGNKKIIF